MAMIPNVRAIVAEYWQKYWNCVYD